MRLLLIILVSAVGIMASALAMVSIAYSAPRSELHDHPEFWVAMTVWCLCFIALGVSIEALVRRYMSGRMWATALALCAGIGASAQPDSTARAIEGTWMQPRSSGQIAHDLPPPANVVTAGYALVHTATTRRDAWWLRIGGGLVGGTLYLLDEERRPAVPLAIAGACFTYSVVLDFRGNKSLRYAGHHLQSGYSVNTRYDIVPDAVGEGPHTRLLLQPTARMSRRQRAELERVKRQMQELKNQPTTPKP